MNLPATAPAPDENKLIAERRDKLAQLRTQGVAFPNDFKPTQHAGALQQLHGDDDADLLEGRQIEVAVADAIVEDTIAAIQKAAHTGQIGDGKIFVTDLERALRIRTGENGDDAL